jgi:hypothetical protein
VGGLGIRRMQHMNNAIVTKSGWSVLVKEDKLWVKLLSSKYLRASPAVMSILSLYVHYSTTIYLFFQIHSPVALSIHSLLYLNILFFILLSHLNIIFFIHSLLLFTSNNYPYNPNSHNPNPSHPPPPPPPPL